MSAVPDSPRPQGPRTLAEASRERRDVVSGEVMDEARLIRFVAGPDGVVAPDLAAKLPGRGVWVAADRASVQAAVKRNLFARSAKAKLTEAGLQGLSAADARIAQFNQLTGQLDGAVAWGLRAGRATLSLASKRSPPPSPREKPPG